MIVESNACAADKQIGDAGAQAVAEALRSGECGLTTLYLDGAYDVARPVLLCVWIFGAWRRGLRVTRCGRESDRRRVEARD